VDRHRQGADIAPDITPAEVSESPVDEAVPCSPARLTRTSVELQQAHQIIGQARDVLKTMFNDVRLGRPLDLPASSLLVDEMAESIKRNPHALISLARLKTADNYSYMHSIAVCALMIGLAHRMGLDEHQVHLAGIAGLLHDIGKSKVPLEVLNKPGPLDAEEWVIMKSHPRWGYELLLPQGLDDAVTDACLHHHEKVDGTGYPDGLKQDDISLMARMTAVCDVYDAITSDRPYKQGWHPAIALQRMAQWAPHHFDKAIFEQFVQTVGIYPLGSLVRLQSQHLAVVLDVSPTCLLTPKVRRFYCLSQQRRITPEILDLACPMPTTASSGAKTLPTGPSGISTNSGTPLLLSPEAGSPNGDLRQSPTCLIELGTGLVRPSSTACLPAPVNSHSAISTSTCPNP
jgi:putative nucleotidyltransferase with HDIG domain